MATDTDHHAYCNHLIHPSGFSSNPQYEIQDVSISDLVNHGSISFGRFAAEPLEWEKRSVFSHNRCQEELEKFRAPGLVAQKKAYFEEYYRKIRAAKKVQSEEQEISQPDPCEDKLSFTSQVHNSAECSNSNGVKNTDGTSQIIFPLEKRIAHQDMTAESDKGKSLITEKQNDNDNNVMKRVQSNITLDAEHENLDRTFKDSVSTAQTCSKSFLPNRVASVTPNTTNKLKAYPVVSKDKVPIPLSKEEIMSNTRTRRDAAKLREKGKPLTGNDGSAGTSRSLTSKKATHVLERDVKSKNLGVNTKPTRSESGTKVSQPAVSRHIPATNSNTKDNLAKTDLNTGLKSKSASRHINVTSKVNNVAGERHSAGIARKDQETRSRPMGKGGQSENQKLKMISINHQTDTNKNPRVGKQIKESRPVHGRLRDTATTTPSNANKATSFKAEKVTSRVIGQGQLSAPASSLREQRNKLPGWR